MDAKLGNFYDKFDDLQISVENLDNSLRKNNITLRGLKEGTTGEDLVGYITELLTACAVSDCELTINIVAECRIGPFKATNQYPRDILVTFPNWITKAKVLAIYANQC